MKKVTRPRGAALLTALLTVALIATLAAGAAWQQWRLVETEAAERDQAQARWLLLGALDWARLVLREDARAQEAVQQAPVDHLGEPWAVPLAEARLSSFLAAAANGQTQSDDPLAESVFLSGRLEDAQGRLNLFFLTQSDVALNQGGAALARLMQLLELPADEWTRLMEGARLARAGQLIMPQRVSQLSFWGVAPSTLARLSPQVTWLPVATSVNVNTASAEVLAAVLPSLSLAQARQAVEQRTSKPWTSREAFLRDWPQASASATILAVNSQYFLVQGQLRMGTLQWSERSLVAREGLRVRVVWRESGPWARLGDPLSPPRASLQ